MIKIKLSAFERFCLTASPSPNEVTQKTHPLRVCIFWFHQTLQFRLESFAGISFAESRPNEVTQKTHPLRVWFFWFHSKPFRSKLHRLVLLFGAVLPDGESQSERSQTKDPSAVRLYFLISSHPLKASFTVWSEIKKPSLFSLVFYNSYSERQWLS